MNTNQINKLMSPNAQIPGVDHLHQLIETNISWVLLGNEYAFKIKKPVEFTFVDFNSLERRKYYCLQEVQLNRRLAKNLYIDVQPVKELNGQISIGGSEGVTIDYAVRMNRLPSNHQMNHLLQHNLITKTDVENLATLIANFHKQEEPLPSIDVFGIGKQYADLRTVANSYKDFLSNQALSLIDQYCNWSDFFIDEHSNLLFDRLDSGFYRNCHGDLHTGNIFFNPDPIPFDCIEFDEELRRIDLLNDIAFLCMDLEASGHSELSIHFFNKYVSMIPVVRNRTDYELFLYYLSYRANVRAKVHIVLMGETDDLAKGATYLKEVEKYMDLMHRVLILIESRKAKSTYRKRKKSDVISRSYSE